MECARWFFIFDFVLCKRLGLNLILWYRLQGRRRKKRHGLGRIEWWTSQDQLSKPKQSSAKNNTAMTDILLFVPSLTHKMIKPSLLTFNARLSESGVW